MNSEFQRIARRDKKVFLSDQCKEIGRRAKAFLSDQGKEIDGNNRMGKTRDGFKKIIDTKGTFYANMGSIKDRNGMDLREPEHI